MIFILIFVPALLILRKWMKGEKCKLKKDLTGEIVIVTGSNTGIGFSTALNLAKMNATIIIASRDP